MSVATLVFFIIGTTVAVLAAATAMVRWVARAWFRGMQDEAMERAMDPHDGVIGREVAAITSKLESIDRAVNQTSGRTLTRRVDDNSHALSILTGSFDSMRGEIRQWRREALSRRDLADLAARLHPDIDIDNIVEMLGEYPPLTVEQARGIARHRAEYSGPDNPEEHP